MFYKTKRSQCVFLICALSLSSRFASGFGTESIPPSILAEVAEVLEAGSQHGTDAIRKNAIATEPDRFEENELLTIFSELFTLWNEHASHITKSLEEPGIRQFLVSNLRNLSNTLPTPLNAVFKMRYRSNDNATYYKDLAKKNVEYQ